MLSTKEIGNAMKDSIGYSQVKFIEFGEHEEEYLEAYFEVRHPEKGTYEVKVVTEDGVDFEVFNSDDLFEGGFSAEDL